MSFAEHIGVRFFELAFLATFLFVPYLAYRGDLENFFFGAIVLYMCLRVIRSRLNKKLESADKAVFITGCDSGFGHFTAIRLSEAGYKIFAGCLFPTGEGAQTLKSQSAAIEVVALDVTSESSVREAKKHVEENLQGHDLWCVINNAGLYAHGDVELCDLNVFQTVADVNLYGMIRVTKAFLPLIRKAKGRVVNMSSINGRYNWPSTSPYCASKFAVESVTDCLRMEMVKFGVKVALIEPAMFGGATDIHAHSNVERYYSDIDKAWNDLCPEVKATYSKKYMKDQIDTIIQLRFKLSPKSPDAVIDAIEDAVSRSQPKYRYVVHGGPLAVDPFAVYGLLYGILPEFITDWIACKVTGSDTPNILQNAQEPDTTEPETTST